MHGVPVMRNGMLRVSLRTEIQQYQSGQVADQDFNG